MEFNQKDYDLINKEFEELRLVSLKRCASQQEYEEVLKAFDFANEAHKGVRRRSGEPYILHPIAVAKIVVQEIGLGYKSIVSALVHDIVEDTDYTVEDIKRLFGEKIASLVDGLTKIKAAMSDTSETLQAENFKRIILTLSDDVRVVLIKLADRLHNVRTIDFMPEHKKDKILSETMYIFVPLAHRLGLYSIKSEMENIWLKNREPGAYSLIQTKLDKSIKTRGAAIEEFMQMISKPLESKGYQFEIYRRTKTPYSIWKKMETKSIPFEEIFDIHAVRIIFKPKKNEEEHVQCWNIYGLVTKLYPSKTDRIRDWVSQPKSNGYEALHCTVMSHKGNWMEIQIRSERMNDIAEKGVAAHWNYKRQDPGSSRDNEIDNWLSMVRDVLENPDVNALEFLDKFHEKLLDSNIYVFTPKGESRSLLKDATALDFAYSIHSQIGNKAIAAKVNLRLVPLTKVLKNGDQIEVITAESQKPQREWMNFLRTTKAKNMLQDALKDEINCSLADGRDILIKELAKFGIKSNNQVLKKLLIAYHVNAKEELYNKISTGLINLEDLENILRKNNQNKNVIFWTLKLLKSGKDKDTEDYDENDAINTADIQNNYEKLKIASKKKYILEENPIDQTLSYRAADCCYPIPGDNVVAFLDDNGDIIIHKRKCENATNLASHKGNRIVNAKWSKHTVLSSLARVRIFGVDRIGILNELTKYTTLVLNINIRKVSIETHDGIFEGFIDCYVHNTKDLETLMNHLKEIKGVETVSRVDIKDNRDK